MEYWRGRVALGWVLTVALLSVGATGCGGDSGPDEQVPARFGGKALAVCKASADQMDAQGPFPYPNFNPTRPDWSKYPGVPQALLKTPEIFRGWLHNMRALGQPTTGGRAWNDLLAAIEAHVRVAAEQELAAVHRDSDTFTKDYHEGRATQDKLLRAARAAGIADCAEVDR